MDQSPAPSWRVTLNMARTKLATSLRQVILGAGQRKLVGLLIATGISAACLTVQDTTLLGIMLAVTLASAVSSIAGFAFSAVCGAILFHIENDQVRVVELMITCSIANQIAMTWAMREAIRWHELLVYLIGGVFGLSFGMWLLLYADHNLYKQTFGTFLLVYGVYMLVRRPVVWRWQHPVLDFGVGCLGGITGGAAAFPGAFVTIWSGMKGWDKNRQRGLIQPFILIMQIIAIVAISLAHREPSAASVGFDPNDLFFIPASLLGTSFGMALYQRLSDHQFSRAVNCLLVVSGLGFLL